MMNEQGNRLEAMFEDMTRQLGVMAEANAVHNERYQKIESRLDGIEARLGELTFEVRGLRADVGKIEGKVDKLEAFASDAGPRLVRIETHRALPAISPRQDKARLAPSKPQRRKPLKRN
jgi:chromosome segregation ATPase